MSFENYPLSSHIVFGLLPNYFWSTFFNGSNATSLYAFQCNRVQHYPHIWLTFYLTSRNFSPILFSVIWIPFASNAYINALSSSHLWIFFGKCCLGKISTLFYITLRILEVHQSIYSFKIKDNMCITSNQWTISVEKPLYLSWINNFEN